MAYTCSIRTLLSCAGTSTCPHKTSVLHCQTSLPSYTSGLVPTCKLFMILHYCFKYIYIWTKLQLNCFSGWRVIIVHSQVHPLTYVVHHKMQVQLGVFRWEDSRDSHQEAQSDTSKSVIGSASHWGTQNWATRQKLVIQRCNL